MWLIYPHFFKVATMESDATMTDARSQGIQITGKTTSMPSGPDKKVAVHSHIRGLGLNEQGLVTTEHGAETDVTTVLGSGGGFVGQHKAREACGVLVELVRSQKMGGRGVLLVGAPGSGKTALALAMAHELGPKVPFVPLVGSEVFSSEVKKTEVLMQHVRRAIGLAVKETKQVYEGQVTQLEPVETESALAGFGKCVSHVLVGLRAQKGTKTLKLDPSLLDSLQREAIKVGDVVYIESNSGAIKRVGRSDAFRSEVDLEAELYVPLPKGDVFKKKELVQHVSLHDLDVANAMAARTGASQDKLMQAMLGLAGGRVKTELTDKLRAEINRVVAEFIGLGNAELVPGVLFIDEAHLLDIECFAFLNRIMESPMSPLIVLATNRGLSPVRGALEARVPGPGTPALSDVSCLMAHGMPEDLLDRLLIVRTESYSLVECQTILSVRAKMENVNVHPDALVVLADIAMQRRSLRYALQLLLPAKLLASLASRDCVSSEDIHATAQLFASAAAQ